LRTVSPTHQTALDQGAYARHPADKDPRLRRISGPGRGQYGGYVPTLLLVALSLGLSNFAAAMGIGAIGVDGRTRLRVGVIFGLFEAGMPIVGLLLGRSLADTLGHTAHWIGAGLLVATGLYGVVQAVRRPYREQDQGAAVPAGQRTGRLLVTGAALSIDNLAVGFALGAFHVSPPVAAVVIGAVSITMSLAGLELGNQLSATTGERGELLGGLVLIGVGIAIAIGIL
jgi:manganese efflux pump family protein